jgi:hypothetical protein
MVQNVAFSNWWCAFEKIRNRFRPKFIERAEFPPDPLPPACGSDPFGLDDFKFFVPLLAELRAFARFGSSYFHIMYRAIRSLRKPIWANEVSRIARVMCYSARAGFYCKH